MNLKNSALTIVLGLLLVGCQSTTSSINNTTVVPTTSNTTQVAPTTENETSTTSTPISNTTSEINSYNIPDNYVIETESYHDKDHVAAYLVTFKKLPSNYRTKSQGREEGQSIGGDVFQNREGLLPSSSYIEADINAPAPSQRGTKRIVYSSITFTVYYTSDHYKSFEVYKEHLSWSQI